MSAPAPTIRLRGSLAPTWLTCSLRATHEAMESRETVLAGPVEVATEFGNRVHAAITGHESDAPGSIIYDEHTPTANALKWQSTDAVRAAQEALAEHRVTRREAALSARVTALGVEVLVTGTLDLVIEHEDSAVSLFDLKTGRMDQRSALAQMAIYAYLGHHAGGWTLRDVVLLHVPRARNRPGTPYQEFSLLRRPADRLIVEAEAMIRQVALAAQSPTAAPGIHCGRCANTECVFHPENDDAC